MKRTRIFKIAALSFVMLIALNLGISATANIFQQGKVRNLPEFNELNLGISAEVYLKQGSVQKVEIQASDKYLQLIETEVKGKSLQIKWTERNVSCSEKIKIYITMVDVNAIRISGSGDIYTEGTISTSSIDLAISGSGNINIGDLRTENISSAISGSADININGSNIVGKMTAAISGSGNIKAQDLPVKNVEVTISGSGDCKVNALETLQARIAGSGDIYYKGKATIDGKVSGSGSIKHVD